MNIGSDNQGARKLRRLVETHGITHARLAREAGIQQSSISRYAAGVEVPKLDAFCRLRMVLRRHGVVLTPEDFLMAPRRRGERHARTPGDRPRGSVRR